MILGKKHDFFLPKCYHLKCHLFLESETENGFRIHAHVCLVQRFKNVLLKIFHYPMQIPKPSKSCKSLFCMTMTIVLDSLKTKTNLRMCNFFSVPPPGTEENILSEKKPLE